MRRARLLVAGVGWVATGGCVDTTGWCDRFGLDCEEPVEAPEVVDADGDVWSADADCDDDDPTVYPGAEERCNGVDDDCDGATDEGLLFFLAAPDRDGDGWGDAEAAELVCALPAGWVRFGLEDCDDDDPDVHPEAEDPSCDGVDQDCDGLNCLDLELAEVAATWMGEAPGFSSGLATGDLAGDGSAWVVASSAAGVAGAPLADLLAAGATWEGAAPLVLDTADCDPVPPAVAVGDVDRDGFDDLVVAHPSCGGLGALWWFLGPLSGALVPSDADGERAGAWRGKVGALLVADELDFTGDGVTDLFVGAPAVEGGGAVFVYTPDRAVEAAVPGLVAHEPDGLGAAVVEAGDLDGDGIVDLVFSGSASNDGNGRVWALPMPVTATGDWTEAAGGWSGEPGAGGLGAAVAALGDVDGDGYGDLALAAPALSAGVIYFADGLPSGIVSAGTLVDRLVGARRGDRYGLSLAAPGDVDGDGVPDLLLGAEAAGGRTAALSFGPWSGTVEWNGDGVGLRVRDGAGASVGVAREAGAVAALLVGEPDRSVGDADGGDDPASGLLWLVPAAVLERP